MPLNPFFIQLVWFPTERFLHINFRNGWRNETLDIENLTLNNEN